MFIGILFNKWSERVKVVAISEEHWPNGGELVAQWQCANVTLLELGKDAAPKQGQ